MSMLSANNRDPHAAAANFLRRFVGEPSRSGMRWRLLGILLTLIIAVTDHFTWTELNISLLYLLPIGLASWKLGKGEAVFVAAFNSSIWFVEHALISAQARSLWIPLLNMVALFGVFLTVVLALSALRRAIADQQRLIGELRDALGQVTTLSGLLPICSWCKKVRDDQGYWTEVEAYFQKYSHAEFTHGICPECRTTHFKHERGGKAAS